MTLREIAKGILVNPNKVEQIRKLDSIIFDCDGVLIDISKSYESAIKKTVDFIVNEMAGIKASEIVTTPMIDGLKSSGGFNDEVDVTYALILSFIAAKNNNVKFEDFVFNVISNADQSGIHSIEKYLDEIKADISDIKKKLMYPGPKFQNPLSSIFDEMFYGSQLYSQIYKREPKFFTGKGLIENDIVLLNDELMKKIVTLFGNKIAIVTGRGLVSTKYSLKKYFDKFDMKNSRFLEDEPRQMAKPNPTSLISTINGMNGKNCMYVGDSMEDFIMSTKAVAGGCTVLFCGVYGTSKDPLAKKSLFEGNNVDLLIESIDLIPNTLNLV